MDQKIRDYIKYIKVNPSKQVVQESFNWDEDYLDMTHKDYKKSA